MTKFVLEIPFGKIEAETYSEFVAKSRVEADFWAAFGQFPLEAYRKQNVIQQSRSHIQTLNSTITKWKSILERLENQDGRKFGDEFEAIKTGIKNTTGFPPKSTSAVALAAKGHFEADRTSEALSVLLGYLESVGAIDQPAQSNHIELGAYYGALRASFASAVIIPDVVSKRTNQQMQSELAAIRDIGRESGSTSDRIRELESNLRTEADATREELTERFTAYNKRVLKANRAQAKLSKTAERNRQEQFDALLRTFNLHMRLKRPVELWNDRQDEHKGNAEDAWFRFKCASIALAVVALLVAFVFGDQIANSFVPVSCVVGFEPSCGRLSPKGPLTVSMILLISTVWLWYLRLQMKIHLSERHLALDARERRAFAETYLSLLKGDHVTQDHEAVVLQSLFRPTQDGIIKDDGGPDFGVATLLSKALDRSK